MTEWTSIATAGTALAALFFGFYKWLSINAEKKHQAHEERFHEHHKRMNNHDERIQANAECISEARVELHRDFVRVDQMRLEFGQMAQEFEKVHKRLGGVSRDLNQAIGSIKQQQANQTAEMLDRIVTAIKEKGDDRPQG